jgi:DNA-binding transcriptional regulator GbsR (MarR family)
MMPRAMPEAVERLVAFLSELGPRWGLPADACRVHGYLYLTAKPATEASLAATLNMAPTTIADSLAWLADYGLVQRTAEAWRTDTDPWDLMLRALEVRRRREIGPALDLLRDCRRTAASDERADRVISLQIGKLVALAEDIAAIEMQTRRFSPQALRQIVGIGGRAARFLDRTLGRGNRE